MTQGSAADAAAAGTPRPPNDQPAGTTGAGSEQPPEGVHAAAGATAATLPVPTGATRQMVQTGEQVFHGRLGSATCTGCHGSDGTGTPLGPDLTAKQYLWGDGSYESIAKLIKNGVPRPKQYREPMPPMGGAQLSPEQVQAVAAYVWGLGHH